MLEMGQDGLRAAVSGGSEVGAVTSALGRKERRGNLQTASFQIDLNTNHNSVLEYSLRIYLNTSWGWDQRSGLRSLEGQEFV